jgi:serine/threonine protein kinase
MQQLLLTLDFMHMKGIVHRDIKIDNILIKEIDENEYNIKIADLGLAEFVSSNESEMGMLYK